MCVVLSKEQVTEGQWTREANRPTFKYWLQQAEWFVSLGLFPQL